jgi:hypothetical protein
MKLAWASGRPWPEMILTTNSNTVKTLINIIPVLLQPKHGRVILFDVVQSSVMF